MIIGIMRISLYIPDAGSLKAKRFVIKSVKDKIKNKFNVSLAEEANDLWQRVELYAACISTDTQHVNSTLENVKNMIEKDPQIEILDYSLELS
ncbi:MAG: DUF503 domain-containing protein [Nitrospirae bacterium]|nr:DUF503 domain-containing protein [Nitrospirota bacterium]MBF0568797.1 DUF503 domain-containing protein [Nitrospirota bacterium]